MKQYKETRRIDMSDLRKLCIEKNWYTLGDNEECSKLLNMVNNENITTKIIAEMATDIKEHSETEYEIEGIMFCISEKCHTFFRNA